MSLNRNPSQPRELLCQTSQPSQMVACHQWLADTKVQPPSLSLGQLSRVIPALGLPLGLATASLWVSFPPLPMPVFFPPCRCIFQGSSPKNLLQVTLHPSIPLPSLLPGTLYERMWLEKKDSMKTAKKREKMWVPKTNERRSFWEQIGVSSIEHYREV